MTTLATALDGHALWYLSRGTGARFAMQTTFRSPFLMDTGACRRRSTASGRP